MSATTTIRIPASEIDAFKALCMAFSSELARREKPLLGRKLYNIFSRCLGHADFNALQQDSKTYGEGPFNIDEFKKSISEQLHSQLSAELVIEASKSKPVKVPELNDIKQVQEALSKAFQKSGSSTVSAKQCPLITWANAGFLEEGFHTDMYIDIPSGCPGDVFALKVVGDSMAREYPSGTIIFVKPGNEGKANDDVVVRNEHDVMFKRLNISAPGLCTLDALKPMFFESLVDSVDFDTDTMQIVGVVVDKKLP